MYDFAGYVSRDFAGMRKLAICPIEIALLSHTVLVVSFNVNLKCILSFYGCKSSENGKQASS